MNYKKSIGERQKLSNLYLNQYINKNILFYPYPIQYIFRYIWLYKEKNKYISTLIKKTKNFKKIKKSRFKEFNLKNKLIDKDDFIILRYCNPQKNKLNNFKKKLRTINSLKKVIYLSSIEKKFSTTILLNSKNKIRYYRISKGTYFFLLILSLSEFIFYLPFTLIWLLTKKRYLSLISSCLREWFSFIIKRKIYYRFYKNITNKNIFFLFSSYGNEAEIAAIKSSGNNAIEILHSHVHIDHYGYNRYFHNQFKEDIFTPDKIIGDEKYQHFFKKINYFSSNIFRDNFISRGKIKKDLFNKLPLLIGQPDSYNQIEAFLKQSNYKNIIYKPHPRESIEDINYLRKKYNLIIKKSNIEKIILISSTVITPLSSVIFSLIETNKKVIILDNKESILRYLGIKESDLPKNIEFYNHIS